MHDRFRDRVGDRFPHDVEVAADEAADEFRFEGFALGELGGVVLGEVGWWCLVGRVSGLYCFFLTWSGGAGGLYIL